MLERGDRREGVDPKGPWFPKERAEEHACRAQCLPSPFLTWGSLQAPSALYGPGSWGQAAGLAWSSAEPVRSPPAAGQSPPSG